MLVIGGGQIEVMQTAALRRFDEDLYRHVRTYFPRHHRHLGEAQIRRFIGYGRQRAAHHGFRSERNVCLYISVMVMLGSNFDVDVRLPWAAALLAADEHETLRIDALANAAMDHLDRVAGVDDRNIDSALRNIRAQLPVLLAEHHTESGPWPRRAEIQLRRIFPRKFAAIGDAQLPVLIDAAWQAALGHGIDEPRGLTVYLVCVTMLGSGFDRDPLLPWAAESLAAGGDAEARGVRLYRAAMAWIDAWLAAPGDGEGSL
jgi:hypothetical protein